MPPTSTTENRIDQDWSTQHRAHSKSAVVRGQAWFNSVFDRPQPRPILVCHIAQLTKPPHVRPAPLTPQHLVPHASPGLVHHRTETPLQLSCHMPRTICPRLSRASALLSPAGIVSSLHRVIAAAASLTMPRNFKARSPGRDDAARSRASVVRASYASKTSPNFTALHQRHM